MIVNVALLLFLAVICIFVCAKIAASVTKYFYNQSVPLFVAVLMAAAMWFSGAFETENDLVERINNANNARSTESIENKGRGN